MDIPRKIASTLALVLVLSLIPAVVAAELGYHAWGLRAGLGDDPDQGIIGAHWHLGDFTQNLRFQPNFELGLGDDHTIASVALPAHYRFDNNPNFTPYAGAGVLLAYIDRDRPGRRETSDFEIAPLFVGGIEWPLRGGGAVFLELGVSSGEAHDAKFIAGWMSRIR